MKKYFDTIRRIALFRGIDEGELESLLTCLGARVKEYEKNRFILMAGDKPTHIGIILGGSAHVIKETLEGDRIIIAALGKGDHFAESLVSANVEQSPVSVVAAEHSSVLLLEFRRIISVCPNACHFHSRLLENMLMLLARKNMHLQGRLDIVGNKTLRRKILSYLNSLPALKDGSVLSPLSREEMADYLCVDRSALSHELSRMREGGELEYRKNRFVLIK